MGVVLLAAHVKVSAVTGCGAVGMSQARHPASPVFTVLFRSPPPLNHSPRSDLSVAHIPPNKTTGQTGFPIDLVVIDRDDPI